MSAVPTIVSVTSTDGMVTAIIEMGGAHYAGCAAIQADAIRLAKLGAAEDIPAA